uniref:Uncharacterized protein n=1 Tax=Heterorhabditis bacteriophora TaxID=37862 RepID=A0A1I7W726_HETBA
MKQMVKIQAYQFTITSSNSFSIWLPLSVYFMVTFNKAGESESVPSMGEAVLAVSRFRRRLGTEMSEIIPFLYLGALRDAMDVEQLRKNSIQVFLKNGNVLRRKPFQY